MNNNSVKIYLTQFGFDQIKAEYDNLTQKRRPETIERLAEARALGDLSENNEYHSAKDELAYIEGRISELDDMLKKVVLIENRHGDCKEVNLGCKVTVKNGDTNEHVFHIVGEWEANPVDKKISHESPLGKSLMGKKIGDKVEVEAPVGKITYTIIKIN